MNINIPKRFESKSALREFFYSRETILTLKLKMNELVHHAILQSNIMPDVTAENAQAAGSQKVSDGKVNRVSRFWVGFGNNSNVVKQVLKQRYWWQ